MKESEPLFGVWSLNTVIRVGAVTGSEGVAGNKSDFAPAFCFGVRLLGQKEKSERRLGCKWFALAEHGVCLSGRAHAHTSDPRAYVSVSWQRVEAHAHRRPTSGGGTRRLVRGAGSKTASLR